MLEIRKRPKHCTDRYFNVCLVLNGRTDDQLCTNTRNGWNNDSSPFLTWYKPTNNVNTVELIFRDTNKESGRDSGHAQIADLKIFYQSA